MTESASTCSNRGKDGEQCLCLRFIPRKDKPHKCQGCKHPESFHPATRHPVAPTSSSNVSSAIQGILERYPGLDRLRPKASEEEARKETNAGLHQTRSDAESSKTKVEGFGRGGTTRFQVSVSICTRVDPQR